jgi:hypothetical protein
MLCVMRGDPGSELILLGNQKMPIYLTMTIARNPVGANQCVRPS